MSPRRPPTTPTFYRHSVSPAVLADLYQLPPLDYRDMKRFIAYRRRVAGPDAAPPAARTRDGRRQASTGH